MPPKTAISIAQAWLAGIALQLAETDASDHDSVAFYRRPEHVGIEALSGPWGV